MLICNNKTGLNKQKVIQKKDRQCNGQKSRKDKTTNSDLQNTTQKTAD